MPLLLLNVDDADGESGTPTPTQSLRIKAVGQRTLEYVCQATRCVGVYRLLAPEVEYIQVSR